MNFKLRKRAFGRMHYLTLLRFSRSANTLDPQSAERVMHALDGINCCATPLNPLVPRLYKNALDAGIFTRLCAETKSHLKSTTAGLISAQMINQVWLDQVIGSLASLDIQVILLKGSAFARYIYDDATPRPGADIDILVKTRHFERACAALSKSMDPIVQSASRQATYDSLFERTYLPKSASTPIVEIHRELTNPYIFKIDEEELWRESRPHPAYRSETVRMLSPEHCLLHLAVHAFRDLNFKTHNLLDAYEILKKESIDWELLIEQARSWGAKSALFYLLNNAYGVMDGNIAEDDLERLRPSRVASGVHCIVLGNTITPDSRCHKTHRTRQLIAQLTIPDRPLSALTFQMYYFWIRILDFTKSLSADHRRSS